MSLELNVGPFLLNGQLFGIVAVMRDITERKRAEEALRESETRFRTVFEGTGLGIALVDFNAKTLSINPAFEHMLGYNLEEFRQLEGNLKYLHPDDAMVDAKLYLEMVKGKREQYTIDKRYIRKDGGVIWGRQTLSVVRGAEGKPKYFVAMVEDITERKRMEDALRESEERHRLYFENASDVIYSVDPEGTILSMSPAVERLLGYKPEELIGKNMAELNIVPPEKLEQAFIDTMRALAGERIISSDGEFLAKDGSVKFGEISGAPIFSRDGKVIAAIFVARDITERKKADEALRESERRLRDAMVLGNSGYWEFDIAAQKLIWAEPTFKLFERDPSLGAPSFEEEAAYYSPEQVVKLREYGQHAIEKRESIEYDFVVTLPSGKSAYMMGFMRPVSDASGKVAKLFGVFHDITERKKLEEELHRLSDAVRMSTDSITIADLQGSIVDVNEATLRIQRANRKSDLIGLKFSDFIAPEEQEKALRDLGQVIEKGCVTGIEYHILTRDGRKILVETNASIMKNNSGEPIGAVAVTRDITDRKRMEEELRQSEENLRMITDNAQDLIAQLDAELVYRYVSPSYRAMLGYEVDEILGKNAMQATLDNVHPDDMEASVLAINQSISTLLPGRTQYRLKHADGHYIWLESQWSYLLGKDREIQGAVIVSRDITERKRIEEALRQSEQSYRVLLESTHDSIIVVDAETFKVIFGNRRAAKMFGFDPVLHNGVGVNLLDFIHPEDRDIAIKGFVEDLFQQERRQKYEVRANTKDGSEIWVSSLGTKIEFQGRVAVLLSLRDVTKDKQMEEEKRSLEEQIQLAGRLAAVGELAAGVAHELNNPIAAIKGFAQFLTARKDLDESIRKDLDTIFRESQRAAKITQNLLSFARRHEPEKHPVSINDVIENILEMQEHMMKINNIELEMELAPDLPKTMADFHQMQQVFMNIVNNAEQAMIEAHGKGRLLIKTQKSGKMVQITFADDGPGISEENLKRIFDPFFTTKEVGKGTGLGLSICYGLIEAHGGRIYAKSKLGQGATFVVEMPIVSENELVAEAALLNPGVRGVKWKKP
jgi:PAS domain S-box-containing protein